jgi:outer membrane murein-binding lipoprotein Lpp
VNTNVNQLRADIRALSADVDAIGAAPAVETPAVQ